MGTPSFIASASRSVITEATSFDTNLFNLVERDLVVRMIVGGARIFSWA